MSKKSTYDIDKFRKLVQQGKNKKEIMTEMDMPFTAYAQFANLELRLFKTDKTYYEIKSGDTSKSNDKIVKIGKNSNLTISSKALKGMAFKVGDRFMISSKGNKITLTLVEKKESEI